MALVASGFAQFVPIPNGDFSLPDGQQWRGNAEDASISFPSTGGNPDGYGLIDGTGIALAGDGVLVQEGGNGPFPASGDGISLASLGLVAGETYTFRWEVKSFTPGSTASAGIRLESWNGSNIVGNTLQFVPATGVWVRHTIEYTIAPEATALKVVLLTNQGLEGASLIGFDNIGVIQTQPTFVLSVDASTANGIVEGSGVYLEGATAILRATPNPGYVFSNWTGDASGSENPLLIQMNQNKTVGADFLLAPEDPDPIPPPVGRLSVFDGVATLSFASLSGYWYQLEASESLASDWVPLV
jgi:hypothetical protein